MSLISQRVLKNDKGVVLCVSLSGTRVNYKSSEGDDKSLDISEDFNKLPTDTMIYYHVDDKTNEILVASDEDFRYC